MIEFDLNPQVITGNTKVLGVMGDPIAHSLSPVMHNAAFSALDLDYIYLPFRVSKKDLPHALKGLVAMGMVGVNLTIPLKEEAVGLMDSLHESAERLGAVNTVINKDGHLWGYNTDGEGFWLALKRNTGETPEGKRILIIGAGGSAQAISICAGIAKADMVGISARNPQQGEELVEKLHSFGIRSEYLLLGELTSQMTEFYDIIVNTTPVGMYPNVDVPSVLSEKLLHTHHLVCDIVYNPRQTSLLRAAVNRGCQTMDGSGMLVYQGALAFELWTGLHAPLDLMCDVLERQLDTKEKR
jgi:shikimate dehydrogenase